MTEPDQQAYPMCACCSGVPADLLPPGQGATDGKNTVDGLPQCDYHKGLHDARLRDGGPVR